MNRIAVTKGMPKKSAAPSRDIAPWAVASTSELRLSKELAHEISIGDKSEQGKEILQLTLNLLEKKHLEGYALLLGKACAGTEGEVTSNLIGQIAYEIERRDSDVKSTGSYFTPHILALDMTKAAAQRWLKNNPEEIGNALWYDPCVGGGIFPTVIAEYLLAEGVPAQVIKKKITGFDINPLFTEATKIRLALILSKADPKNFLDFYYDLTERIICGDSLLMYPEEKGIFSADKPLVDIVIGNPPYVRSNSVSTQTKETLRGLYPSIWSGTTDLYMFFIAHGLNALKNDGVLCYVSPATFQRTSSSRSVRKYISDNASVDAIYDFDELGVFQGVGSHISVYVLSKTKEKEPKTEYTLFSELPQVAPFLKKISGGLRVRLPKNSGDAWNFHPDNSSILSELEQDTTPLRSLVKIYSGIKTGLKKAYELSEIEHAEILADAKSQKNVLPLLKPKQIQKWRLHWDDTYQIVIPRHETIDIESKAYKHLLAFRTELEKRADLKKDDVWYGLRDCAYLDLFKLPKIVYRDISSTPRFALDTTGMLVVDGAFFIPAEDYFLLGLLNSKVGAFYFKSRCSSIGSVGGGGRLRFKKVYVSEFPVPKKVPAKSREAVENLVKRIIASDTINITALEQQLDDLIFDLYGLSPEYRSVILKQA